LLALAGGAYLAASLRNGWFPWDEGSIAVTAERVLLGQLPHRDFLDLYTGVLTFINAGAFRLLGIDLVSPRIVLLFAFVAWLVVFFKLGLRFVPPWLSALVTALAIVWSVPNYPAAVPSWYNLFFATGGLLAIIVYSETRRLRWALLAGVCGGLSISVKVVGVFFLLGVALFTIFDEQTSPDGPARSSANRSYSLAVALFSAVVIILLTYLVARDGSVVQVVRFVLPMSSLVLVVMVEEWRRIRSESGSRSRHRSLARPAGGILVGVLVPLSLLVLPYLLSGATLDLLRGTFVLPASRLEFASAPAPPILSMVFPFAVAGLLSSGTRLAPSLRWFHYLVLTVIGATVIVASSWTWQAFMFVYLSAYNLTPIVILSGCVWVAFTSAPMRARRNTYALLSVTAGVAMVEFPYAGSIYFFYTAPLVILALAALTWHIGAGHLSKAAIGIPWAFYFVFGVAIMNPQPPGSGGPNMSGGGWEELALPRARLRVIQPDSTVYGDLVRFIRMRGDLRLGYAGPDSPEVYFLTESYAATPVLFDFLSEGDGSPLDDPGYLDGYELVVINHRPDFSRPIRPTTLARVAREFPLSETIGRFEVRWRE
jgi:hypothetical protein